MSIANENGFDPRYLALAKQCYHGTVHGSVLLKCIELRPGKTVADLWAVIHSCDFLAADRSRRTEGEMQSVAVRLAQIVVFPRQVEMSPVAQVVNLARTKGIAVEQDSPGSEEVLGEFARFLSRSSSREQLAKDGIDKVLESFPGDVFRSLAVHLAALLCPEEWQESLGLDIGANGQVIPGGSMARAFVHHIEHEGGKRVLARKGLAALVERFRAAGGKIKQDYAGRIASDRFPDEYAAGKAAVRKVKTAKPRRKVAKPRRKAVKPRSEVAKPQNNAGIAGRFVRFMDRQGGAATLAEQGFDACLAAYQHSGGRIRRQYAKKIVTQHYQTELRAQRGVKRSSVAKARGSRGLSAGLLRFMSTQGGVDILAAEGFDACLAAYERSGGTIEREYAKSIVAQRYPAELLAGRKIAKARALNARPTEGVAGAFVRFMDTQGGASILGEESFSACLSEYRQRGGVISHTHASYIVTRFYRNERPAGEDASEATDAGPRA